MRLRVEHFPAGVYHVDLQHLAALGGGSMEAGEALLHRMFKMAGPRAIHSDALRELGSGDTSIGRRIIRKFLDRLHTGADRRPARYVRGGAVGKMTKQAANYRDSAEDNKFCARCSMYLPRNNGCSLVAGPVHRVGLCDYFQKAKS